MSDNSLGSVHIDECVGAFVPAVDGRHAPPVDSAVLQGDGPGCGFQSLSYVANGVDVCDSEGRKQCTKTQDNADVQYECSWPQACPQGRVHTRVVQQLALPVHSVQDSKRLIRAIREVLQGASRVSQFVCGSLCAAVSYSLIRLSRSAVIWDARSVTSGCEHWQQHADCKV